MSGPSATNIELALAVTPRCISIGIVNVICSNFCSAHSNASGSRRRTSTRLKRPYNFDADETDSRKEQTEPHQELRRLLNPQGACWDSVSSASQVFFFAGPLVGPLSRDMGLSESFGEM
jgi:hypothetical protein